MDKKAIIQLLKKDADLSEFSLETIKQLSIEYPNFSAIKFLLAEKAKQQNNSSLDTLLPGLALAVQDRQLLFNKIGRDSINSPQKPTNQNLNLMGFQSPNEHANSDKIEQENEITAKEESFPVEEINRQLNVDSETKSIKEEEVQAEVQAEVQEEIQEDLLNQKIEELVENKDNLKLVDTSIDDIFGDELIQKAGTDNIQLDNQEDLPDLNDLNETLEDSAPELSEEEIKEKTEDPEEIDGKFDLRTGLGLTGLAGGVAAGFANITGKDSADINEEPNEEPNEKDEPFNQLFNERGDPELKEQIANFLPKEEAQPPIEIESETNLEIETNIETNNIQPTIENEPIIEMNLEPPIEQVEPVEESVEEAKKEEAKGKSEEVLDLEAEIQADLKKIAEEKEVETEISIDEDNDIRDAVMDDLAKLKGKLARQKKLSDFQAEEKNKLASGNNDELIESIKEKIERFNQKKRAGKFDFASPENNENLGNPSTFNADTENLSEIQRYMKENYAGEELENRAFDPKLNAKLSSSKGSDLTDVTETLAKIYEKQGDVHKAKEVYEKLSLKFPEKSSYFADRIEMLKKIR